MKYVVVYEPTPTRCSAYLPDLPGCVAAGETRKETGRLIGEAVGFHIYGLRQDNEPIPDPGAWTQTVEV